MLGEEPLPVQVAHPVTLGVQAELQSRLQCDTITLHFHGEMSITGVYEEEQSQGYNKRTMCSFKKILRIKPLNFFE